MNRPTLDSIFGNTYNGVPNPNVPHVHPYPTRFHGPNFRVPRFGFPYVESPYTVSPFNGFGTACCSSCARGGPCEGSSGMGACCSSCEHGGPCEGKGSFNGVGDSCCDSCSKGGSCEGSLSDSALSALTSPLSNTAIFAALLGVAVVGYAAYRRDGGESRHGDREFVPELDEPVPGRVAAVGLGVLALVGTAVVISR